MLNHSRLARATAGAAVALAIAVPSASAACPDRPFTQVYSAWGDMGLYTLAPNGDFEAGLTGWTVAGDARLVADTPGRITKQTSDHFALELAPGSSATSAPICVASGYPASRMFANTVGRTRASRSTLQVEVLYTDPARGGQSAKKLGTLPDERTWDAARKMSIVQGQLDLRPDSNGSTFIQYRFTPLYGTTWRIDDLNVDPRLRA
jgi:hypothetical protein